MTEKLTDLNLKRQYSKQDKKYDTELLAILTDGNYALYRNIPIFNSDPDPYIFLTDPDPQS